MRIENGFEVSLPPDQVYELLLDLERVAPCMPGAELHPQRPDGSYPVTIKVRLGALRFTYDGSVRVAESDPAARRAVLAGEAREARGQGTAGANITMTVAPASSGSSVTTAAEVELTGRAAQMGHGVVASVAEQLIADMARCLEERFAAEAEAPADANAAGTVDTTPAAAKPVGGLRLLLRALVASLRRMFRRG